MNRFRKNRPLERGEVAFRDTKFFIVSCDDRYAPKQYFEFFRFHRVKVHVEPTEDGTSAAKHVLERLLEIEAEEGDERWLVLDTDHYIKADHIGTFLEALTEARQSNVKIALSRPCFEFWLLLHHISPDQAGNLQNAQETETKLREVLGSYRKDLLRTEDYTPEGVLLASQRSYAIEQQDGDKNPPDNNTSRIYQLWRAIVESCTFAELAEYPALKELKEWWEAR